MSENKQSLSIYTSTLKRIAVALLINQAALAVLGSVQDIVEEALKMFFLGNEVFEAIFMALDCAVYTVSFVLPVIIFYAMSKNAEKEPYFSEGGKDTLPPLYRIFALFFGLGAIILAAYANSYIISIFPNYSDFTEQFFWDVELKKPYQVIIYFINVAIIPAFVEELLFRRVVCGSLEKYGRGTAIIISAVLFALMHTNVEQLFYTLVAGLILGWIYVKTRSLIFPVLLHFLNNGLSVVSDVVHQNCDTVTVNAYTFYSEITVWILMAISLVAFLVRILKKGRLIEKEPPILDENGETVARLSAGEKIKGFFNVPMTFFVAFCAVTMALFVILSEFLI